MGLDTPRSFVYGAICSLLAPSGYGRSREPESQPFGLSLMPHLISGGNSHSRNTTATFNGRYAGHHEVQIIYYGFNYMTFKNKLELLYRVDRISYKDFLKLFELFVV